MLIKPTRSSEDYCGANVLEVVQELFGVGFNNITLKPICKLTEWSRKKYGKIVTITINGNSDFLGLKKIPATSFIIIEYMDFKPNVNPQIYEGIKCITPGKVYCDEKIESITTSTGEDISSSNISNDEKLFCAYCGKQIKNKEAKYCSYCGKEI